MDKRGETCKKKKHKLYIAVYDGLLLFVIFNKMFVMFYLNFYYFTKILLSAMVPFMHWNFYEKNIKKKIKLMHQIKHFGR
jgi:hypothetical protein